MEQLVFNTAEHKLEELEKYGFVRESEFWYSLTLRNEAEEQVTLAVSTYSYEVQIAYSIKGNVCAYLNIELTILYDLIKDGLVIEDKSHKSAIIWHNKYNEIKNELNVWKRAPTKAVLDLRLSQIGHINLIDKFKTCEDLENDFYQQAKKELENNYIVLGVDTNECKEKK